MHKTIYMKNLLTAGSILLMSCLGFSQDQQNSLFPIKDNSVVSDFNFYLDTRYDSKTTFGNHIDNSTGFQVNRTRIYLNTKIKDKMQVFLRYSLNASKASNALEFAYLEYSINDRWAVSLGKLVTAWGSFEIDYNGADLYSYMDLYDNLEVYTPGVNIAYMIKNHRFNFQVTSIGDQFAAPEYINKAYSYMFLWQGSFFEDKLTTRYGYGLLQHNADKFYNWVTIGNQLNIDRWFAEIDWVYGFRNFTFDPNNIVTGPAYNSTLLKENSLAASVKYYFENWNPYLKAVYNKRDALDQDAAFDLITLQAAVEYNPFKKDELFKDLRLFASYQYSLTEYKKQVAHLSDVNQHQVLAGVRWLIPIAKSNKQDSNYQQEVAPYL